MQLFAVCLLLVGFILAAVGTGLTQWARFETEREFPDDARSTLSNGRTYKTQVHFPPAHLRWPTLSLISVIHSLEHVDMYSTHPLSVTLHSGVLQSCHHTMYASICTYDWVCRISIHVCRVYWDDVLSMNMVKSYWSLACPPAPFLRTSVSPWLTWTAPVLWGLSSVA